jgi:penicillin-binding protein 2
MRLSALAIVVLSLVGALTARLWYLTAVEGEASVQAADANRIRTIHIQAPRGRIFDTHYSMLVDNQMVRQVRIDQRALDQAVEYEPDGRELVYRRLADALNLYEVGVQERDVVRMAKNAAEEDGASDEEIEAAGDEAQARGIEGITWTADLVFAALENNFESAYVPTPVAQDIPEDLEVLLAENQLQYPGVDVEPVAVRYYPHGSLGAHLLGYVKAVTVEELESDRVQALDDSKPYALGDDIGKSGVELAYEEHLRGTPGTRVIEVDADNNPVRTISYDPPIPGDDLRLAMDIGVQQQLETSLREQAESHESPGASGMVMDPRNGAIIAMASYPTFDPTELSGPISPSRYRELTAEDQGAPLNNKVISGQYLPGSTWKPITAIAALRAGLMTPETSYNDTGVYLVAGCEEDPSCRFTNPDEVPNGPVALSRALTVSSDTYFYHLGDQLWGARDTIGETALQDTAHDFGINRETNVDLPSASDGFAWTPQVLADLFEERPDEFLTGDWVTGDTVNMAIGQGYLGVTPLQLTNLYATIGNGGTLQTPHVAQQILRPNASGDWTEVASIAPEPIDHVDLPPGWRGSIMAGLSGVPQPGGTASEAFDGFDLGAFPVAGKTGTAQKNDELDYGLFVGMGPVMGGGSPAYVATSVFEASGQFGGTIAAPPIRQVFDVISGQVAMPPVPNSYLATPNGAGAPMASTGEDVVTTTTAPS